MQSYGAIIAGHAHPKIVEAITPAAQDGTELRGADRRQMKLAEEICFRVPSCEQVRLVNSGTEATMTAIRLARASPAGQDREVRRQLPRPAADLLLAAGGIGHRHARPVGFGRGHRSGRGPDRRGAVQRGARASTPTWRA